MARPTPQELVTEIIAWGKVGSTICGELSYVKEAMRLLRAQVPEKYRFEVDAAEQYRDDFATFDAIGRFLLDGQNQQKKHLIVIIRAWHGYRDYFDHMIMLALRNDSTLHLNISLVFVFPPYFKNGREIEQNDKLAHIIHANSTLKLTSFMTSLYTRYLDEFSRRFKCEYLGSEQQAQDRAMARKPPGSFLCPEQEVKKRSGQLHPDSYAI